MKRMGDVLAEKNLVLKGADPATAGGFTQVPNFILTSKKLGVGAKLAYAMLLRYAWQNDFCFPGQAKLAVDMGVTDRSVRTYLKQLEKHAILEVTQRGLGKTNLYSLTITARQGRK